MARVIFLKKQQELESGGEIVSRVYDASEFYWDGNDLILELEDGKIIRLKDVELIPINSDLGEDIDKVIELEAINKKKPSETLYFS